MIKEIFEGRSLGGKILIGSVMICLAGITPLLLYIPFGPKNGNPIGLGLLAMLAIFVGIVGGGVGVLLVLVQAIRRSSR